MPPKRSAIHAKVWALSSKQKWLLDFLLRDRHSCIPPNQISFEPGFGAYQGLAQKIKVPFSGFSPSFCSFGGSRAISKPAPNPGTHQTPVETLSDPNPPPTKPNILILVMFNLSNRQRARPQRSRPHKRVTPDHGFMVGLFTSDATIKSKHFRREEIVSNGETHVFGNGR